MQERQFHFFHWNPAETTDVYDSLFSILEEQSLSNLTSSIYTITKDLILNGTKANYKRIFFIKTGLDINHPGDYELGVRMFKSKVLLGSLPDFAPIAKELNLWVEANFISDEENFTVKVKNNQSMVSPEILKIRTSLVYAQNYDDIMEYYLERADDSEGEGIGIALIIILLKDLGVPVSNFRIENQNGFTEASIAFPWSDLQLAAKKESAKHKPRRV
jgi:hypothetical protein